MTTLVCNTDHNAYAQTLDHKEIVKKGNAHMVVQETAVSKCVVVLGTLTFSTLIHIVPQLMTLAVETQPKTNITKNGMLTWTHVTVKVSCIVKV